MNVLATCEESQVVCKAFRARGHNAFSCDIIECSGGHPEWHIKGDVLPLVNGRCKFKTMDGTEHKIVGKWDMIIAFVPCTKTSNAGARHLYKGGKLNIPRYYEGLCGKALFLAVWAADCDRVVIENPTPSKVFDYPKPTQAIQPYQFGHPFTKKTLLWERGVQPLKYEIKFKPRVIEYKNGKGTDSPWHMNTMSLPPEERARARSKTYVGLGEAMAEQWG